LGKNASDPPLTFRAPAQNRKQLRELKKLWGDTNQSRVITRCIEWAWLVEIGSNGIDVKPGEIGREEGEDGTKSSANGS